ncbi:preprotein translocase subunit YajC [Halobacillus litoralis]|uniref:Preprotein translocase subunit YajC n=1 Tax=Halobacillus litoralis TaxID=45668 RepID=A0A845E7N9_9BACI|nr:MULTISPECIES: preprotein translocase subunit YajC [Halobacillus]MBN9653803.1 preprotein translocase subunit YajC [Halobacillus sp. GSS1]MYL50166.1 preprotein translocase subunit YajC [Halobacillus litoralis]
MDTLVGLLPIILMFVIFYFLLIRPQQKKQKQVQQMQSDLQKGDRVITIGGLHGTIHAIDEGSLVISVQDGTQLKFDRSSVREKLS